MKTIYYRIRIFDEESGQWANVRRSDGYLYQYEDKRTAERMAKMTYPNLRPQYVQIIESTKFIERT